MLNFYAEAYRQSECKNLPKVEDLCEGNVCLIYKQKMGKKMAPMEECIPQATALHEYIQETLFPYLKENFKVA